jgi:hypothetical protein
MVISGQQGLHKMIFISLIRNKNLVARACFATEACNRAQQKRNTKKSIKSMLQQSATKAQHKKPLSATLQHPPYKGVAVLQWQR